MSLVERALKKLQESRAATESQSRAQTAQTEPVVAAQLVPAAAPTGKLLQIDRAALRAGELLPPPEAERRLAQDYRQIKRPLIDDALRRGATALPNGHTILVASALPGDGKSFTSLNLAFSMALEKDISVLLVDADLPRPHLSRVLGLGSEPGLLDALRDERLDVESLIFRTDIPGLSILPSGPPSDTATEFLASKRMETLLHSLGERDRNRIVLIDSPPLLLTTESRVLSSVVGQVVLVVSAGSTPQQAVLDAVDLIGEGKKISLILNQCDLESRAGYYQQYGSREAVAEVEVEQAR
jgi:exopolysaccharide/PEP-CTERM locus tyrosine autokinase